MAVKNKVQKKQAKKTNVIKNTVVKKTTKPVAKKVYKKNSTFTMPSSIVKVEIEKESVPLQLPSAHTPADMRLTEYFRNGTEPSEESNRYQTLDNPTNGKGSLSGNIINISFDGIETPAAIDPAKLQEDFNENYGQFAKQYYEKRIAYNNASIGELGYQIYLDQNGTLTPLAYIKNTSYSYDTHGSGGTYKFVVKSAYSIFKDNMSNGLEISVTTGINESNKNNTYVITKASLKGNKEERLSITSGAYYEDPGLKEVIDVNGNDVTKTVSVKKTILNTTTQLVVKDIDLSEAGTYTISYDIEGFDQKLTRTVIVS